VSAFKKTVSDYENYCQGLQNELASYKDTEGINELKEIIREKDHSMREI
jgi:cell shape-determining protein MreC